MKVPCKIQYSLPLTNEEKTQGPKTRTITHHLNLFSISFVLPEILFSKQFKVSMNQLQNIQYYHEQNVFLMQIQYLVENFILNNNI